MAKFKCIGCGEIIESNEKCTCPVCGCNMYAHPYNRAEILRREIIHFVDQIIEEQITADDLLYQAADKENQEYMDIDVLRRQLPESPRPKLFQDLIAVYTFQFFAPEFQRQTLTYHVSMQKIHAKLRQREALLTEILAEFCMTPTFSAIPRLDLKKTQEAKQNSAIFKQSTELAAKLNRLTKKICDSKEQYHIPDEMYMLLPDAYNLPSIPDDKYWVGRLPVILRNLEKALAKRYVPTAPENGYAELQEMMEIVLESLLFFHNAPIQKKQTVWYVNGEAFSSEEKFLAHINRIAANRFAAISKSIHNVNFLYGSPETQLFSLYQKIMKPDTQGLIKYSDPESTPASKSEKALNALIGLRSIKGSIRKIRAYANANKDSEHLNLHMCFYGNPGTGKTEVARIIASILHESGLLPSDKVVETDRTGLVAGYVGQTAIKTTELIQEAMGGVLFIDEAYSLVQEGNDFGHEAVSTLIKAMEDYRGKFCVILAGYQNPLLKMLATNPGFRSRIQFHLHFPDYTRSDLKEIASKMLCERDYTISQPAMGKLLDITDVKRKNPDFANARELRNLLDQVIMCQNLRCAGTGDREIGIVDVNSYIRDAGLVLPTSQKNASGKILTAEEELEALIGLASVKRMIRKIKAYAKRNKENTDYNLHMCFYGNPGTGKTETARILSRLLYDAGVLPEARLIETDAHGLTGKVVGETAPKTLAKINDAMGGVLFIDEAYSLAGDANGKSSGYGDEAISVLLKEMEDRRGQFCVVLAGYKKEMKRMIGTNPGLASRIQFTLDFPDYTKEELREIALSILQKKKYRIEAPALELVLEICEYFRKLPDFANARTVRNILEQVIMNQNLRTEEAIGSDDLLVLQDVEEYLADENIDLDFSGNKPGKIGF